MADANVRRETHPGPAFDFSGLTQAQRALLTFQGWEPDRKTPIGQPRPQTVQKLLQRKLVVARPIKFLGVAMKAYDVPMPVHIAWCAWCAKHGKAAA